MSTARTAPTPFPVPQDLRGRTVGRFVIRSKLGAGGMGEVYYAEDPQLKRPVALKRVSREQGTTLTARQRILREAQRASALQSDHIASVYDVVEDLGEVFLVMEYVEGRTLRERLREPMTLEQFFEIATQCAEALVAAHQHGIVHCDIKPENIMLTAEGRVKILDFGVAKHLPRSDLSSTLDSRKVAGTPCYMAPEVLLEDLPDARSDIFSLGVVLYEMLTRKNPFLTDSFVATSERVLHQTPTAIRVFNPHVPEEVDALVMKAMAKPVEERYGNASELLRDLRQLGTGTGKLRRRPLLRKKTRFMVWMALLLVLGIGAKLGIRWWGERQPVLAERGWVLITDFDNSGDHGIPDRAVREGLSIALQQSRYVNVFPHNRAYEVLQRMKRGGTTRLDESIGREICRRENLQVLLAGNIARMGQMIEISVRGIDPAKNTELFAEQERFANQEEFFEKLDSLAKRLRKDLGESLRGIEKNSRPLARVTTSSLEALQLYSEAKDAQDQGREEQAPVLLQGALRLDSDFAMAHMRLGQYYAAFIGRNEKALAELERAYQLREEVSDREQRRIEAAYFDMQGRCDEKADTLRVLVSLYPDDEEAHLELAAAYYDLGLLDKAIPELYATLKLNPYSAPAYGDLVLYLARSNRDNDAIAMAHKAEEAGVGSSRMFWGLGLSYLGLDNVSMARQEFGRIGQATEIDRDLKDLCFAVAELYEGKLTSGQSELLQQIEIRPHQNGGLQLFRYYLLGRIYLMRGNVRDAERQADEILRTPRAKLLSSDFAWAGSLYAQAGRVSKARQVLGTLEVLNKTTPNSPNRESLRNLEGEIFLAESKPQEAEVSFSDSTHAFLRFSFYMGLARAHQAERRWNLAAGEWEKVLGERGEILQNGFPPDLVIARVEAAGAYHEMNHHELARKNYEEALRMWQHGDGLPLLRNVRHQLDELASEASSH